MEFFSTAVLYGILFFAVYVQVFLLLTFLETRTSLPQRKKSITLSHYPTASIIVPCCNEEKTLTGTVESLLRLEYPQDKLQIILVNDGSTDATGEIMEHYGKLPNVRVLHKENGGKHTALNMALDIVNTEFVGTLDADSFITPLALQRVIASFQQDADTQAVVSSILIHRPQNWLQKGQKAEFEMSIFVKNMLAKIGGLHVTPGPFSFFRTSVFAKIGKYKQAYNTEDGEMALRLQRYGMKITYCTDSFVYTVAPDTIIKLFKQRVRWTYGFFRNLIDYRDLLFRKKYNGLAFFTLPSAVISFLAVVIVAGLIVYQIGVFLVRYARIISTRGIDAGLIPHSFDFSLSAALIIIVALYMLVFAAIAIGRKLGQQKLTSIRDIIWFVVVSSTIAPVWIIKSMADAARSRQSRWK